MIRINLAQKKQASYVGGAGKTGAFASLGKSSGSGTGFFSAFKGSVGDSVGPLLLRIVIPAMLCGGAYFGYEYYTEQKIAEMAQETDAINNEKNRIEAELRKIKGYEVVKLELERNELILRTKIQTIEKLIRGRDFTVKSLVVLSQALPREVWLNEITTTETGFNFRGGTIEIGLVSDLMSKLGQTIYFKDVTLKSTSTDPNQRQASFELTARRE
jgi:Tfp pilus assembly protein PilN